MTSSSASSSSTAAKRGAAYETLSFDTGTASRFSLQSLFAAVKEQDRSKGDLLAQNQAMLHELKREISLTSKKNYTLEKDIKLLDGKIALLIRNRISLEEVLAAHGDMADVYLRKPPAQLQSKSAQALYGRLFFMLQREPRYLARLTRLVSLGEIDNLLQTVMFTLYGNQYEPFEEHLLLSLFGSVLEAEFAVASDLGSLLRANTAITRMMTTYTRRGPGQTFLKNVLGAVLKPIFDRRDLSLEVNPVKVYQALVEEEEARTGQPSSKPKLVETDVAAADPDVKAVIEPRLRKLDALATHVVDGVIKSLDDVPYGIRWICQQIRRLVRERFPDATREQTCSLIGGFFLLRFVNPAVVTPQAFMMVESKLSPSTRRNLTLLAKVLQNLANNVRFGGLKEAFMQPLNGFLDRAAPKMNSFLEELTRVSSLEERLSLDHFRALAQDPDALKIHISQNEMYTCHRLLRKHVKEVCGDDGRELAEVLDELGEAPDNLPRAESGTVDLQLVENKRRSELLDERPEQLYSETKWLLFSIVRSVPALDSNADIETNLALARQFAEKRSDTALVERIAQTQANLQRLTTLNAIDPSDNYAQLRRDVVRETLQYERQIEKTTTSLKMLREVYRDVMERNDFLKEQLEAYKQYLDNVRKGAATTSTKSKGGDGSGASLGGGGGGGGGGRSGSSSEAVDIAQTLGAPSDVVATLTHAQLEKDGIVRSSDVPAERRAHISLSFTSPSAGVYAVAVLYKSRQISDFRIKLDDLLERKEANKPTLNTEFMRFDVEKLLLFFTKKFVK